MNKMTVFFAALAAAFCASAEIKVGTIDMMTLVRNHPDHAKNRQLLQTTDRDYQAKLEKHQAVLKALSEDARKAYEETQNPMLAAAAKTAAQGKLESIQQRGAAAQQEYRADAQRFQEELSDLEARLLKMETEDIRAKIAVFAEQQGYDVVVDATMLGYAKKDLDVTDAVLTALGVDPASAKRTKDPGEKPVAEEKAQNEGK